jgi:anti-sigma factor RsiW
MTSPFEFDPNAMKRTVPQQPRQQSLDQSTLDQSGLISNVIPLRPPAPDFWARTQEEEELDELDDRFELLSAYIDGEATPAERQQVETWLATDREFKQVYEQLSAMQQGFHALPVPTAQPARSIEQMVDRIVETAESKQQRKWKWHGGAIAALFLAAASGLTLATRTYSPQMANTPSTPHESVAMERSVVVESPKPVTNRGRAIVSRALFVE